MPIFSRKKTVRVLVATRHPAVPTTLTEAARREAGKVRMDVQATEAISMQGAYEALPGCNLVVIDLDDLAVSPDLPRATLEGALVQSGLPFVGGADFVAQPHAWLEQAVSATGLLDALPPRTVMITGYSGGAGKTTLSLNLARYVAGRLKLPVALVELSFGAGSLRALTEPDLPDLYDVLTQEVEIGDWQGITLLPMAYSAARLLLNRSGEVKELFQKVRRSHALTLVDAAGANPFRPALQEAIDRTLVVADPRPDAVANLHAMVQDLGQEVGNVDLVLNKVNGLGDKLALSGVEAALKLPHVPNPRQDKRLAEGLLQIIYPGWRPR